MHKLRSGGGGGGGRRGGGVNRVVDAAPAVWQSFISSNIALCQLIVDELTEKMEQQEGGGRGEEEGEEEEEEEGMDDDPMYEETIGMISEQIDALESIKKKKLPFSDRMGLIGMLIELTSDQLPLVTSIEDKEKATELQIEEILTAALSSALHYGQDCIQRIGGVNVESKNKLQHDSEQESLMCMKLLDTLMGSMINEEDYARRAVLTHVKSIIDWLRSIGISKQRSPTCRQAALSVLSNLIESDTHLLSPPPAAEEGEGKKTTEGEDNNNNTPHLTVADRSSILKSLMDACFELCSQGEEEELSVEVGQFSSQNLGTALLDCLCTSITPAAVVASDVLSRSSALLNSAASSSSASGPLSALLCLAVLPSTAPTYCKENVNEIVALCTPSLTSGVDAIRAAAFVCIGELLENVSAVRHQYGDEWLSLILSTLRDSSQSLPLKHKVCLPLIQLAAKAEDEEGEEEKSNNTTAIEAASSAQAERITLAVLDLIDQQKAGLVGGGDAAADERKSQWQFVALLTAALENSIECVSSDHLLSILPRILSIVLPLWTSVSADVEDARPAKAKVAGVVRELARKEKAIRSAINEKKEEILTALIRDAEAEEYTLRTAMLETWTSLIPILGSDVLAHIDELVPSIIRSLDAEYTINEGRTGRRRKQGRNEDEEEDEEEPEEEEDEDMDEEAQQEDDDIQGERVAALRLFQQLMKHFGEAFLPFHEQIWSVVCDNVAEYPSEVQEVVTEHVASLPALFKPSPPSEDVESEKNDSSSSVVEVRYTAGVTNQPPAAAQPILKSARSLLYSLMLFSVDSTAVAAALDAFAALVNEYGQWILVESPSASATFIKHIKKILKEEAICQQGFQQSLPAELRDRVEGEGEEEDGAEEDGEEEEHPPEEEEEEEEEGEEAAGGEGEKSQSEEDFLLQHAMDCLVVVAKARGASFDSMFSNLYPYILRAAPRSPNGYVFGCLADLTAPLAVAAHPAWVDTIVPKLLSEMEKQIDKANVEALRNISYAVGCILFAGQAALSSYREKAAKHLVSIINLCNEKVKDVIGREGQSSDGELLSDIFGCRDNASSALAKLLLVGSDSLALQLPSLVPPFLTSLPVREDAAELPTIYSALVKMANTFPDNFPQQIQPFITQIINSLEEILALPIALEDNKIINQTSLSDRLPAPLPIPKRVHDFLQKGLEAIKTKA